MQKLGSMFVRTAALCIAAAGAPSACHAGIPDGMQWGVTREQVRARDFTIKGKRAEKVFRRWATGTEDVKKAKE